MSLPRRRRRHVRPGHAPVVLLALCALWGPSARAQAGASAVKGPYLTDLSDTGVVVRFELDVASEAKVQIEPADSAAQPVRFFRSPVSAMHAVSIDGLRAATSYDYVVRSGNVAVGQGHFDTAPDPDSKSRLTFLVYGDTRTDPTVHAGLVRAMSKAGGTFLIHTGDMVANGASPDDWQSFFAVERDLLASCPLFVAIGNHELVDDDAGTNFARYVGMLDAHGVPRLYGSVRLGPARFFFLNAMDDWSGGEERAWLDEALGRADAEKGLVWRIAVLHQGPWSAGPHGPNPQLLDGHVPELFASHGVDLVLSGHDHIYERGAAGAVKYVVSGGGGAPLYPIVTRTPTTSFAESAYHFIRFTLDGDALELVAYRPDGSILDRCGFRKAAAWDCDPPRATSPSPVGGSAMTKLGSGFLVVVGALGLLFAVARRRLAKRRGVDSL